MLYAREAGPQSAPAIVFLHGGGLSSKMWQPVVERLQECYCLAPDLPGHGESRAVGPFTLDGAADRVAALIRDRVPSGKAHVVGLSLGGAVLLTLLRRAPDTVERAMSTGSAAGLGRALGTLSLATLWVLRFWSRERLVESTLRQQGIPERYKPLVYEDLLWGTSEAFNRTILRALMGMQLPLYNPRPLLVAVGEKETRPAKAAARTLVAKVPMTTGVMVPRLGHMWALQDPDLFAATVRAWAEESPLPAVLRPLS